ncbi:MAG: hypothetical protein FD134_914 [Gallionellaceae bacterium]|nr:MAG: hypothetical protein FD134_914 [Gallionellaceae bacterium]
MNPVPETTSAGRDACGAHPDSSLLFATAFYHAAGRSPNAWTFSEQSKLAMYYRCMVVCYASIRRLYPQAQLALFTNRELSEPYSGQLRSLGVSTVICADRYVGDRTFRNGFPGCLYTLDVIEHLALHPRSDFSSLILIDSDCIFRYRLGGMPDNLASGCEACYAYAPGYPVGMVVNGQSRATLTLALRYFSGQMAASPIQLYGGEFYGLAATSLPKLAARIEAFWAWMKTQGAATFGDSLTEEHVMSVVLAQTGDTVHSANGLIKRIWTASAFSTVDGSEAGLPVWHLPAEKKKGFAKLYRYWLRHDGFAGLSDEGFRALVDQFIPLRAGGREYPGRTALLRLRGAARFLVTGRA